MSHTCCGIPLRRDDDRPKISKGRRCCLTHAGSRQSVRRSNADPGTRVSGAWLPVSDYHIHVMIGRRRMDESVDRIDKSSDREVIKNWA